MVHQAGGKLYAAGYAQDKLFGPIAINYVLNSARLNQTGTVTITQKGDAVHLERIVVRDGIGQADATSTSTTVTGSSSYGVAPAAKRAIAWSAPSPEHSTAGAGVYNFHYRWSYK